MRQPEVCGQLIRRWFRSHYQVNDGYGVFAELSDCEAGPWQGWLIFSERIRRGGVFLEGLNLQSDGLCLRVCLVCVQCAVMKSSKSSSSV